MSATFSPTAVHLAGRRLRGARPGPGQHGAKPARQVATHEADSLGAQGLNLPSLALSPVTPCDPERNIYTSSLRWVPGDGICPPPVPVFLASPSAAKKKEARALPSRQGGLCVHSGLPRRVSRWLSKYLLDRCTHTCICKHIHTTEAHMDLHMHTRVHTHQQHTRHPTFRPSPTKDKANLCFQLQI